MGVRRGGPRPFGRPARSLLFSFLIAGLCLPALTGAAVHRVSPEGSISAALVEASAGDTIWLEPGEYFENVVIDIPVTLTGEGRPHIRGQYRGTVVHVLAPGTVIRGLQISEAGTQLMQDMACILVEADDVLIEDNLIEEPLHGIYVKGGSRIQILGNRIEGRLDLIEEDRGNGIHMWNSRDNHLEGNEIFDVRDGIYFSFTDSTKVVDNHIHGVRYGLHYMYSNHNTFEDNLFERSVAGAALMYSNNIHFLRNVFARCRGFRAYGILYQSMDDTRAEDNLVLDNSRGIFLNNVTGNALLRNDIVDNDLAIQLNGDGGDNVIARNNFINNLSELLLDVGVSEVEWEISEGGNYWTGYSGYDLDGDGIGDHPHTIQNVFQVLESDYPEVRFYLFSLAAETLEMAERALPILKLGRSQDHAPSMRPWTNRQVPWSRVEQRYDRASFLAAAIYLLATIAPLLALVGMSRQ